MARTFCFLLLPTALVTLSAAQGGGAGVGNAVAAAPPLVRENATVKVAPHTYVIPDFEVGQVPNVGIVVGSRATLVIDPGLGTRNGETVLRETQKVSKNSEMFLATTHYHTEHTLGLGAFPSARYVNSKTQDADFVQGWEAHAKGFASRTAIHKDLVEGSTPRRADITFDSEHTLDLGDVRVRMIVVGPTHTRGDTIFFVEGDNVLFAGDVVMNESFVAANQGSSMSGWLAAFDMLEKMQPRVIVPAHGKVGDGALIGMNRAFMLHIQARVRTLKTEGRSIDESAAAVEKEMQARHPTFARLNGVSGAARAAYNEAR
ncbi:MAG: MBL fold metallo-hydrolase [Acidobacteria bacterium]|nr:MBL fold metallo-hydrolase [Acidobacteriota bacterium]